jgi:hypothetical protein
MTNLDMSTAESLQVGNYGFGGHYRPHWDMPLSVSFFFFFFAFFEKFQEDEYPSYYKSFEHGGVVTLGDGSRIATILFYVRK